MQMISMSDKEFTFFRHRSKSELVKQRAEDLNISLLAAEDEAETEVLRHLPHGQRTENNFFYHLKNDANLALGYLWFGLRTKSGKRQLFIYDILVEVPHRGKGFGRFMLQWLEVQAKLLSAKEISLHVLGYNKVARELYESAGYEVTNVYMAKPIN